MNIVKKVISITSLTALIAAMSLNAAQHPEGSVNEQGQLVLPGMDPIDPPAGEVVDGNLVINGQTIVKPEATILEDGSLQVGTETFAVPSVPLTAFLELFDLAPGIFYHEFFGTIWPVEGTNWLYVNMFSGLAGGEGAWAWMATSTGNSSAFWIYSVHFDDWFFMFKGDLGLKNIFEVENADPAGFQNGFIYSANQSDWRYYLEDANGGYFNYNGDQTTYIQTFSK